jgi:hypothetical protein
MILTTHGMLTHAEYMEILRQEIQHRSDANIEILRTLFQYFVEHPGDRFHQALKNLNIVKPMQDQYYVESWETLQEAWKALEKLK